MWCIENAQQMFSFPSENRVHGKELDMSIVLGEGSGNQEDGGSEKALKTLSVKHHVGQL